MRAITTLLICWSVAGPAGAQRDTTRLNPITITVQRRFEKVLAAPAGVTVIDSTRLTERPALTVFDQIKDVAGVTMVERGLFSRSYFVRGPADLAPGGGAYTITDYRIASVPSLGFNVPYLLPSASEDLQRVEVVRGPASAMYGPNALSGIVHLLTQSPFDARGTRLSLTGGERDFLRGFARHARALSEGLAFRVAGQYSRGRDWEFTDSLERAARDFDLENYGVEARVDWNTKGGAQLVFSGGSATAANGLELVVPGAYQVRDWRFDYLQARLTRGPLFAQLFFNDNHAGQTFSLRTLDRVIDDSRMVVAQLQSGVSAYGTSWTYGLDLQLTNPRTGGTVHGRNEAADKVNEFGLYLHAERPLLPRLRAVAAARMDQHNAIDGFMLSPRAALVYEPAAGHALRATFNRAFRSPTPLELFVDLRAARLDPLPYEAWLRGPPNYGWRFRRDCSGGLCMRSPGISQMLPLDATLAWSVLVSELRRAGLDLTRVPAPQRSDVSTVLRVFDPAASTFYDTSPGAVTDREPLQRTVANAVEIGYRGLLRERLRIDLDGYYARVHDFIRGPFVLTPSAFLSATDLAMYLARFIPASLALQAGQLIGGVSGSRQFPGIPVGTVAPDAAGDHNIILTYESFGAIDQWGSDISLEAMLGQNWWLTGAFSYLLRKGTLPGSGDSPDQRIRVPRTTGAAAARYQRAGISAELRARFASGYDAWSALYQGTIENIQLVDANISWKVPLPHRPMLTLSAQNALDRRKPQELGSPAIGRLVMVRLLYDF